MMRPYQLIASLMILAPTLSHAQAEVVGSLRWLAPPMPSTLFGLTPDDVTKRLHDWRDKIEHGQESNRKNGTITLTQSSARESGISLQSILASRIAKEVVYAIDVRQPVPLSFNSSGSWQIDAPDPRSVRIYYQVAFDAQGRLFAGMMCLDGPTGPARKFKGPSLDANKNEITYWNIDFGSVHGIFKEVSGLDSETEVIEHKAVSFWKSPYKSAATGRVLQHKCKPDCKCGLRPERLTATSGRSQGGQAQRVTGKGGNLVVHKHAGAYQPSGYVLIEGELPRVGYRAAVGRSWGIASSQPGENGNPPPFWVLEHQARREPQAVCLSELRLILEVANPKNVQRANIVPAAHQQAGK